MYCCCSFKSVTFTNLHSNSLPGAATVFQDDFATWMNYTQTSMLASFRFSQSQPQVRITMTQNTTSMTWLNIEGNCGHIVLCMGHKMYYLYYLKSSQAAASVDQNKPQGELTRHTQEQIQHRKSRCLRLVVEIDPIKMNCCLFVFLNKPKQKKIILHLISIST